MNDGSLHSYFSFNLHAFGCWNMKYYAGKFLFIWLLTGAALLRGQSASRVKLIFTGDIMVHKAQLIAARTGNSHDFAPVFRFVRPYFKQADFVIGNLETTLGVPPWSGYPLFSSPPTLASALRNAGFTHVVTANNHALDRGKRGLLRTLYLLDSVGLQHTGTFASESERDQQPYVLLKKNGITLALMNYTFGTNGIPIPDGVGVNVTDTIRMKKDIERARRVRPDAIVVFLHWGSEYRLHPGSKQRAVERFLHRQGIRFIVGSHPHVIQPVKVDSSGFTAYSLGNFVSNQRKFPRDGAFMLAVEMEKQNGRVVPVSVQYIPVWVYKNTAAAKPEFEILPSRDFMDDPDYFDYPWQYARMMRFEEFLRNFMRRYSPRVRLHKSLIPNRQKSKKLTPVGIPRPRPVLRLP